MRKFTTASMAAMAFAFLAAPASAQAPWSGSGELTDGDSVGDEQHRYDDHPLRLEAGRRYRIAVDSQAFDPVARLYRAGQSEPVAENDDSDGLNPRISYTPAESGDYSLRVSAFAAEGRGAYTAGVGVLPPLPPGAAVPWSVSGRIEDGDSADADGEGNPRYDEHVLRLEAGRRYRISVDSEAFDPMARLYGPAAAEPVAENDDSGGTLNSRISYAPTASGDYVLRVIPLSADGRGAYRAAAALAPPLPAPATFFSRMEATIWRVYTGSLAATDAEIGGPHFDDYLVRFEAGQQRTITLDATGAEPFDTVVQIFPVDRREGEPLASNDDSGGTLNSMLTFKAERAGDYIVRATALSAGGMGPYRLRVSE